MKAERRHELKENDLTHALQQAGQYLQNNGKSLGIMVLVVVGIVLATTFVIRARETVVEDRWSRMSQLTFDTPENTKQSLASMLQMAGEAGDDQFAMAALLEHANRSLRSATSGESVPDKELTAAARQSLESLLRRFPNVAVAVGTAHLGLVTVEGNEFALDGDAKHKEKAREHLQAVLNHPALKTLPHYQRALDEMDNLDETFTAIVFAPALPGEEVVEETAGAAAAPPEQGVDISDQLIRIEPPEWATKALNEQPAQPQGTPAPSPPPQEEKKDSGDEGAAKTPPSDQPKDENAPKEPKEDPAQP